MKGKAFGLVLGIDDGGGFGYILEMCGWMDVYVLFCTLGFGCSFVRSCVILAIEKDICLLDMYDS